MTSLLFWIGWYNALGPLVLLAMHREEVADFVLRRSTEVLATRYQHGDFGRMWLWWAATANGAVGAIMVLAVGWPEAIQRQLCIVVLALYAVMYVALALGARGPKWGRGVAVVHLLWVVQIGWLTWALLR